ncbi:ketopantoate reductase [Seinonella peptonophila]|uniref:2-dehydropantoate 2-reductase n=1 Tax=Seinonella peptonophila TaxID=112248 RepID=A0A1M4XWA4_9BACL|nr:ketopantoate reductase family protein [Seinonella peptonophila]SHE97759.1 ketopantoate reductase [Seinonella peptonophila]
MRVGIVGAGAVGGYFGGRLAEKGADVTFLVRPNRKKRLTEKGLVIHSPIHGNSHRSVSVVTPEETAPPFDLLIVAVKAYHLDSVIPFMQTFSDQHTMILPLLNGYAHIDHLQQAFSKDSIFGGFCFMESTLDQSGEIHLLGKHHRLVYGELQENANHARMDQLKQLFADANLEAVQSDFIETEMWNKYQYIAALSGMTTLMRSEIGAIRDSTYGSELYQQLLNEIYQVTIRQPLPKPPESPDIIWNRVQKASPQSTSSMYRDLKQGLPIETDHLHGSLVRWGKEANLSLPILTTIYTGLSLYQPSGSSL